nr:hypothetical protein [uncultured Arsenicibacter sp.]
MRHPIEKYNQRQAEMLATLPEEERAFWARQHRIGNAAYSYQYQFNDVAGLNNNQAAKLPEYLLEWLEQHLSAKQESHSANELLKLYFEEYLDGLPNEKIREGERSRGLEEAKRSVAGHSVAMYWNVTILGWTSSCG